MIGRHDDWNLQLDELTPFILEWCPRIELVRELDAKPFIDRGLPSSLAKTYAILNCFAPNIMRQNRFLEHESLALQSDRCVFYVENQYVYEWAISPIDDDPPVYGRLGHTNDSWALHEEPLSRFVCQTMLHEALLWGDHYAHGIWLSIGVRDRILKHWQELLFGYWFWPVDHTKFYAANRAIAMYCPQGDHFDLYCASIEKDGLDFMREFYDDNWTLP